MRASSSARLAGALFVGVAAAAAPFELAECLNTKAAQLAASAACGHAGSIEYCLANRLPTDSQLCTPDVLAQCFVNAGCQPDEALIEAAWTIKRCERGAEENELRRRSPADASSAAAGSTAAATTVTSTSTSAATTLTSTKVSSYSGTTSSSLVCETTKTTTMKTCPTQSTGTASGKEMSCYSTQQTFPTCAAGLMCTTSDEGVTSCMKKRGAGLAGIVIGIVFGSAIVISVSTLFFFCCRERRADERLTKAAEAAAIARQAVIDSKKARAATAPAISVSASAHSQPLMASPNRSQTQLGYSSQYAGSTSDLHASPSGDIAGPNPFADTHGLR